MLQNFEETKQIDQLRSWILELTHFTPQQVETVIQNLPMPEAAESSL